MHGVDGIPRIGCDRLRWYRAGYAGIWRLCGIGLEKRCSSHEILMRFSTNPPLPIFIWHQLQDSVQLLQAARRLITSIKYLHLQEKSEIFDPLTISYPIPPCSLVTAPGTMMMIRYIYGGGNLLYQHASICSYVNSPSPLSYIFIIIVTLVGNVGKLVGVEWGRKYYPRG